MLIHVFLTACLLLNSTQSVYWQDRFTEYPEIEECAHQEPVQPFIINGTHAKIDEFPYSGRFFGTRMTCGVAIITRRVVLTAGHCLVQETDPSAMWIVFGRTHVQPNCTVYYTKRQKYGVCQFAVHEDFNTEFFSSNDIALILLHRRLTFGDKVNKVYITNNNRFLHDYNRDSFLVAGWGRFEADKPAGPYLRYTSLTLVSMEDCVDVGVLIGDTHFCLTGNMKKDTCRGDSGSAVTYRGVVVGLVSFGVSCDGLPGAYTNVYKQRPWIKRTLSRLSKVKCDPNEL